MANGKDDLLPILQFPSESSFLACVQYVQIEDMQLNRVCDSDLSYMVIISRCASKVRLSHQTLNTASSNVTARLKLIIAQTSDWRWLTSLTT